jgi:hypothetical protein
LKQSALAKKLTEPSTAQRGKFSNNFVQLRGLKQLSQKTQFINDLTRRRQSPFVLLLIVKKINQVSYGPWMTDQNTPLVKFVK